MTQSFAKKFVGSFALIIARILLYLLMMKNHVFVYAACCLFMAGCAPKKEPIPPVPAMQNSGKIVIYQMMTRLFGNQVYNNITYGTLEENGVGKFNDINEVALESIKELGVTHIWYTGIIEHALLTDYTKFGIPLDDADIVKGRAGSPYSIKDYYDVNPDLAVDVSNRMNEFEKLVERTHTKGLKVIIDFVPNHVARGYKSDAKPPGVKDLGEGDDTTVPFHPNNNFYYLVGQAFQPPKSAIASGTKNPFPTKDGKFYEVPAKVTANDQFTAQPGINDWFEAVKLNYGVDIQNGRKTYFDPIPDTWVKMRDILVFWAGKKVDGFRCDVAEMVPVEFWNWVIPQVKEVNPEIIFIAEIYTPSQYRNYIDTGGFDFLYDKVQLYDTLRGLIGGTKSTRGIAAIQDSLKGINKNMLHFLENHDEQRITSKYFAGEPWKAMPAMVISATIDKGPVMIYFGQELGEPAHGDPGFQTLENKGVTTKMDYWGVTSIQQWINGGKYDATLLHDEQIKLRNNYSMLLTLAHENLAIAQGDYYDLTEANIRDGNFKDNVHAFIRAHEDERLLIVTNFSLENQRIKISIGEDVANAIRINPTASYMAKDVLWSNREIVVNKLNIEFDIPGSGAYIFKIQ